MDSTIPASARIPVIFDTDPGIDDALALALLARHPRFELLAVTTAFGNAPVETTTRNARGLTALYRQRLAEWLLGLRRRQGETVAERDLTPEQRENLKALGYVQ